MSAEEFRAIGKQPKASKYRNKPVRIGRFVFASKKEANRYLFLKKRQDDGEISHLEVQPEFKLYGHGGPLRYDSGRHAKYIADFSYFCPEQNKRIVEDVKSPATRTPVYKLKKAIVESQFPAVKIVEV